MMDSPVHDWLHLILRWFHVIAGIMWIGTTYLFNWMERTFAPDPDDKANIAGRLWMVHGGGFYLVEKQKVPELMPRELHWFKWESAMTWLSGMLLLLLVYYSGGMLTDFGSPVDEGAARWVGLGSLVLAWVVYDLLWRTPLRKAEPLGAAACFLLLMGAARVLSEYLSSRTVFIHVAAMMGTVMAANVWMRILPGQRRMLAAVKAGQKPDMAEAAIARRASKHNTYMSVPLIFLMLSNHFPFVFGHAHNCALLGGIILFGWGAAKLIRDVL